MSTPQLLVLDAELLFAQRLYELARRRWPTTPYQGIAGAHRPDPGGVILRAAEVLCHAHSTGHDVLLVTTEALALADGDCARNALIDELTALSRDATVRLVVVAFESVLSVVDDGAHGLRVTDEPPAGYTDALARLTASLDADTTTVIAAPPYVTHCESRLQPNPAHVLWREQARPMDLDRLAPSLPRNVVLADRIIEALLTTIEQFGVRSTDTPAIGRRTEPRDPVARGHGDGERWAPSVSARWLHTPESRERHDTHLAMLPVQMNCSLKVLYRKHPQEALAGGTVANVRQTLGRRLAGMLPPEIAERIDLVVPVPETGRWYAAGVADALGKPCVEGIYKQVEGRSFDIQNHAQRREFIKRKLNVDAALLAGKAIAIVDEAIFTGATLRQVAMLLRETEVESVYLLVASPECKNRCGANMQPDRAMLSEYVRDEALAAYFDVNGVFFQNEHEYEAVMADAGYHCTRCFRATNTW